MKKGALVLMAAGAFSWLLSSQSLAEDKPKVEPPGDVLPMADHYSGSVGQAGDFPGTLVCLRSKEAFVPLSAAECGSSAHVFALEMKDDKTMRPIELGSKDAEKQMKNLINKPVVVTGRFHSATGQLIASSVKEKDPAS